MTSATDPPVLLEVGRIVRVHGLRGELVVDLTTNVDGRLAAGTSIFTDPAGTTSLEIVASRPHQHRWLIQVDGISDRSQAEALGRPTLYAEPVDDPDAIWVHELFGKHVIDSEGIERGVITDVLDNPASELLVLDTGHLVPLDFLRSFDDVSVVVEVPDGLWDL